MASLEQNLIKAAHDGDILAVRNLVKDGADVHAMDERGEPAFMIAFELGHEEVARYLAEKGAGSMAEAYEHRRTERQKAMTRIGVTAKQAKLRMKSKKCLVCGNHMNYMRFYVEKKHFCADHEGTDADMMHAMETLSAL